MELFNYSTAVWSYHIQLEESQSSFIRSDKGSNEVTKDPLKPDLSELPFLRKLWFKK